MRVEPCCVPADDEALRPPSVATRALFEEASRILDARIPRVAELDANRAPATGNPNFARQQGACYWRLARRLLLSYPADIYRPGEGAASAAG